MMNNDNIKIYTDGFDDGIKAGRTEILNDLGKTIMDWKRSSEVIDCHTLMQLIEARKTEIDKIKFTTRDEDEEDITIMKDMCRYRYEECPECKSELKIKYSSLKFFYLKGYYKANIKCPCCNKEFLIGR